MATREFLVRFDGWSRDPQRDSRIIHLITVAMAEINRPLIHENRLPPLYRSGVVYREERAEQIVMLDAPAVYNIGSSDCKNLVAWRMAEHREAGVPCDCGIDWYLSDDGLWQYHVFIHLSGGIEDPSRMCGM